MLDKDMITGYVNDLKKGQFRGLLYRYGNATIPEPEPRKLTMWDEHRTLAIIENEEKFPYTRVELNDALHFSQLSTLNYVPEWNYRRDLFPASSDTQVLYMHVDYVKMFRVEYSHAFIRFKYYTVDNEFVGKDRRRSECFEVDEEC